MSRPLVIAHRGSSGVRPENTFSAFERAIEDEADMIETDLHLSRDGVVVIHHDAELERVGLGGEIRDRTMDELGRLDVSLGGEVAETMPRLDELLDRFGTRIAFNLELKVDLKEEAYEGMEEIVFRAVEDRGLTDRILFSSFYDPVLARLRARSASARIALLVSPRANFKLLDRAARLAAEAINPDIRLVTPSLVAEAHAAGLRVYPYTANDSAEMARLIDCGVDGVITNHPAQLRTLLRDRENG